MKCLYCKDNEINREEYGLSKCNKCKSLYFFKNKSDKIREITFFTTIDNKYSYRVDHNFENCKTIIYNLTIDGEFINMKIIFNADLFDLTPHNAQSFFKNKLKLYQLFS